MVMLLIWKILQKLLFTAANRKLINKPSIITIHKYKKRFKIERL